MTAVAVTRKKKEDKKTKKDKIYTNNVSVLLIIWVV